MLIQLPSFTASRIRTMLGRRVRTSFAQMLRAFAESVPLSCSNVAGAVILSGVADVPDVMPT